MKLKQIIDYIEEKFPPAVQESYDNSGLITGDKQMDVSGALLTIDIDENVIDEAIEKDKNLIIAHHPIIFRPIKKLTGSNYIERCIIKAIKNNIAIYAAHTSLDNNLNGLNAEVAKLIGLKNIKILEPKEQLLFKIAVFVPVDYADKVREAMFKQGAGSIGNYDNCSYNINGTGTFRANEGTNPFVGQIGKTHLEKETKIESIAPSFKLNSIINAIKQVHPYEEVAYDIYPLHNKSEQYGAGITGELQNPMHTKDFLELVKTKLNIPMLKHSEIISNKVQKIAICTGAGHFLIDKAYQQKADALISAEFKYDQYISAKDKLLIIDAGHYETEIFVKKIFYDLLSKKFSKFAVEFSEKFSNPVKYF